MLCKKIRIRQILPDKHPRRSRAAQIDPIQKTYWYLDNADRMNQRSIGPQRSIDLQMEI